MTRVDHRSQFSRSTMLFVLTLIPALLTAIIPIQLATAFPLSLISTANDVDLIEILHNTGFLIPSLNITTVLNLTRLGAG